MTIPHKGGIQSTKMSDCNIRKGSHKDHDSTEELCKYHRGRNGYVRKKRFKKRRPYNVTEPITSYGLLLFSFRNSIPYFLLYQRRDNFEYMDFLRGVWSSDGQLPALFSLMSHDERKRIREYTFQELWDDLWVEHDCRIYRDGFGKAKKKYDSIRNRIPHILDTTNSHIKTPPWGFPKGKKNGYYEDAQICALREFEEETHISIKNISIVQADPFIENFKGSNGKAYATHYYLAEIPSLLPTDSYSTPQCIRKTTISEEASDVEWFNYGESGDHLNHRRRIILKSALENIEEIYTKRSE